METMRVCSFDAYLGSIVAVVGRESLSHVDVLAGQVKAGNRQAAGHNYCTSTRDHV